MLSLTSVDEAESFEKQQQMPDLYSEVSWCLCNADDSRSDYIGLDWLHIAYKLFLNLCSILLPGGRRSSLTIIHPSIFILRDRSFCKQRSVMCCSIWTLSPEGKQKNTPFRFPCGAQSLSCSTKTPMLPPLSRSSVRACFLIQGCCFTCNWMLVSGRTKESKPEFLEHSGTSMKLHKFHICAVCFKWLKYCSWRQEIAIFKFTKGDFSEFVNK